VNEQASDFTTLLLTYWVPYRTASFLRFVKISAPDFLASRPTEPYPVSLLVREGELQKQGLDEAKGDSPASGGGALMR
jgi:hypothetical protein